MVGLVSRVLFSRVPVHRLYRKGRSLAPHSLQSHGQSPFGDNGHGGRLGIIRIFLPEFYLKWKLGLGSYNFSHEKTC